MSPLPELATCRRCDAAVEPEQTVRLWDGRDYCRPCVEKSCPGLADYAAANPTLDDQIPYDHAFARRSGLASMAVILFALSSVPMVLFLAADVEPSWAALGSSVAFLVVFGVVPIGFGFLLERFVRRPGFLAVHVRDGLLTADPPFKGPIRPLRCELGLIRWFLGVRTDDGKPRARNQGNPLQPRFEAVVLVIPDRHPSDWQGWRIATGSTPEMVRRWTAFLRLAEIPEGRRA